MNWLIDACHDGPWIHFAVILSLFAGFGWLFTSVLGLHEPEGIRMLVGVWAVIHVSFTRLQRLEKRVQT